jgi:hypothetical protein
MKSSLKKLTSSHHLPLIWLAVILVALLIAVFASRQATAPSVEGPVDGSSITISGEFTCLPHKDTSGPQTLECAFGLKSGDIYYALGEEGPDYNLLSEVNTGQNITVTGTFQSHPDTKYQDIGTITVSEITK